MNLKTYTTGIQHIGIPTNDIEKTIEFYQKLGFEIALRTVNEEANEKVAFLKQETLVIETYENKAARDVYKRQIWVGIKKLHQRNNYDY